MPTSEVTIVGSLNFHKLAVIVAGVSTAAAILLSFYLMWMHALHYTKPSEQKQYVPFLPPCCSRERRRVREGEEEGRRLSC